MSKSDEKQVRAILSRTTKLQLAPEVEAFCPTCPPVEDVSALLATLGFHLAFQMEARDDLRTLVHLPALPAQYHYKDVSHGTEVIYLAGRDTALEGEVFPFHASRFWLYPGADMQAFQLAMSTLALGYQFTWRAPCEDAAQHEEVA
jgi:hypothetical protein